MPEQLLFDSAEAGDVSEGKAAGGAGSRGVTEAGPDTAVRIDNDAASTSETSESDSEDGITVETSAVAANLDVSDEAAFEELALRAVDEQGGRILFKMRIEGEAGGEFVAAAVLGDDSRRRLILLSRPTAGGELRIEVADGSRHPIAPLARSFAGLAEVFAQAA